MLYSCLLLFSSSYPHFHFPLIYNASYFFSVGCLIFVSWVVHLSFRCFTVSVKPVVSVIIFTSVHISELYFMYIQKENIFLVLFIHLRYKNFLSSAKSVVSYFLLFSLCLSPWFFSVSAIISGTINTWSLFLWVFLQLTDLAF